MAEDLGKQVELQAQLNKLLQDRIALQERLNSAAGKQVGMSQQLNSAQQKNAENQEKTAGGFQKVAKAQEKAAKAQDKAKESSGGFLDSISVAGAAAVGAVSGLFKGFKGLGSILGSVGGLLGSVVGGLFKIGKSILAIPFSIFSGLVSMANNAAAAGEALRQAYEDVRKEFGSFTEGPAKNVIGVYKDLRSSAGNLAGTGLRASRVFGYGPEGMAKMMGAVADLAKSLGPAMSMLGNEFKKSAGQAIMFSKGMGLSSDQMAGMMKNAKLSGKSQADMMTEVGSMSLQMAKKFGISSKDIGRDIADMKGDFVTFGTMSTKQMAATSAYARKLGMDLKDLKGVVDKFDDFEGAAESVSQLNQAFGIQLDTMKMMNAENPAERIDMMRKAFFAAGKSIETMNRHEKKLLMTQTGLSESALKNAFAAENQGVAYEDFADASEDAEANQMSQQEVMLKLAKAIEKISKAGQGFTGIFDALGKGFMFAVTHDPQMKEMLGTIRRLLKAVFLVGKTFGEFFMRLVKGSKIIKNLNELFNPKFLLEFNAEIKDILKDLGDWLLGKSKGSPEEMFDKMFDRVGAMFTKKGAAGKKVLGSLGKLYSIFGLLFTKLGGWIAGKIWTVLEPVWVSMKKWFTDNAPMMKEYLKDALKYMFVYAVAKSVVSAAVVGAITAGLKWIGKKIKGPADAAAKTKIPDTGKTAKSAKGLGGIVDALKKISLGGIVKAAVALALLGGAFAFNLWIFSIAIAKSAKTLEKVKWKDVGKVFGVMAIALAASVGLIFAGNLLFANIAFIALAAIGVAAAAGLFSVGMILYAIAIKKVMGEIGGIDFKQFVKFLGVVGLSMVATVGMVAMGVLGLLVKLSGGMLKEGLHAAAELFEVGMVRYAKAIKKVSGHFRGINFKLFIKGLAMVGLAIAGTVNMVAVGVLGKLIKFVGGWLTDGLEAAAEFFETSMTIFVEAIVRVNKKMARIPKGFGKKLKMIGDVVKITGIMMSMAGKSLVRKWFGSGTDSIEDSAKFFVDSGPSLIKMVNMISRISIPDEKKVRATIGIIKDIVATLSTLSILVERQQHMAMVASIFGSQDPANLIRAMTDFFSQIMDKLIFTVQALVKIAQGMSKSDLDKARIVAEIITAIAKMAEAIMPAMQMMQGGAVQKLLAAFNAGASDNTDLVITGMQKLFDVLIEKLPKMITTMIDTLDKAVGKADPKTLIAKAKVMGALMDGVKVALKSIGGFQKMVNKQDDFWTSSKGARKEVEKMLSSVAQMLGTGGAIRQMIVRMGQVAAILGRLDKFSQADIEKNMGKINWLASEGISQLVHMMFAVSRAFKGVAMVAMGIQINSDLRALQSQLTNIALVVSEMDKSITTNLPDLASVQKNFKSMCIITSNLSTVLNSVDNMDTTDLDKGTGFLGRGPSKKDEIIAAFDSVADLIYKINSTIAAIDVDIGAPMHALAAGMTSAMEFSKKTNKHYFGKTGSVVQIVQKLVDTYNATDQALQTVAKVDRKLSVRLKTFAQHMGLDSETFKIENEKLNFTINVEVVLDAEKIIDTFNDKAVMGKRTVLVRGDVSNGGIVPP